MPKYGTVSQVLLQLVVAYSNFTCQYPEVASRTENSFAWGISATTFSTVVIGKCSLLIASFESRGSMHMGSLLGFTTATMLFTQSVSSFCLTTTSAFYIRSSFSLIFSLRKTGTFRGGCTTGEMLESTLILCSPGRQPRPWNRSKYCSYIFWAVPSGHFYRLCCWSRCTRARTPRSLQVWAPNTVGASISTTWKFTLKVLPPHSQGNVTTPLVGIWWPE